MAIKFEKVSYVYDAGMPYAHTALKDIDLIIPQGQICAIIGETGSGKSTLVEHLNALLLPNSGQIEIGDQLITSAKKPSGLKKLRKNVGLVFQFAEYQLFEETILKDAMFGPKNFGDSDEEALIKAQRALKLVGIDESLYQMSPLEISGGQKRRVAIAGIIATDPEIMVLDEPTAGLDPKGAMDMIELFVRLNKEFNKTVVIVSHDNDMVYTYADHTVVMADGQVAYSGDTVKLFNDLELCERYGLLKPQVILLKEALIKAGFKLTKEVRTLDELVKLVKKEVR